MVTKQQAINGTSFESVSLKDSRGNPVKCRANGKCKVWKTRPEEFKLPVKYGIHVYFYITHENASEWRIVA